jgi:hypothetical protein
MGNTGAVVTMVGTVETAGTDELPDGFKILLLGAGVDAEGFAGWVAEALAGIVVGMLPLI